MGSVFTGRIGAERLNIEPLVGIVTIGLGGGGIETGTIGLTTISTIGGDLLNVQIDRGTLDQNHFSLHW